MDECGPEQKADGDQYQPQIYYHDEDALAYSDVDEQIVKMADLHHEFRVNNKLGHVFGNEPAMAGEGVFFK